MLIDEHISGTISFRNGTEISISDSTVISASCKKQCCSEGKFEIGGVYAASLSLVCRISGTNSFNLRGAKILLRSWYKETESAPKAVGTFWITDAKRKTGDIYAVTAKDSVGWLDTSSMNYTDSQNRIFDSVAKYFEAQGTGWTLNGWFSVLTQFVNTLIERISGISNAVSWKSYDESVNGAYCNHYLYPEEERNNAFFFLSTETGSGGSDCPRDLYRHLASLAGGFVYANIDGKLTLGQFGQPEFGTAEISTEEIEFDSCEIADYQLQLLSVTVQSDILDGAGNMAIWTSASDYDALSYFRIQVDSNPFLDGFTASYVRGDGSVHLDSDWTIANALWGFPASDDTHIRPFCCKVHKPERYNLGQKIRISYQGLSDDAPRTYESIITSVTWTFRGGHTLACGGEDARTMADALRMSKSDKALKETRSRCTVLEKKIEALS